MTTQPSSNTSMLMTESVFAWGEARRLGASRSCGGFARELGFTLVEVLVALVITSLLVSILMGIMYYVYRVQDALRGEVVEREFALRTRNWFSEVVAGCVPAAFETGAAFSGSPTEFACDTVAPLRPGPAPSAVRIAFRIEEDDYNERQLFYSQSGGGPETAVPILKLPAGDAMFVYAGVDGKPLDAWVAEPNRPETLPRRVSLVVRRGSDTLLEWLATPRADAWLEPVIRNPFGVGLPR